MRALAARKGRQQRKFHWRSLRAEFENRKDGNEATYGRIFNIISVGGRNYRNATGVSSASLPRSRVTVLSASGLGLPMPVKTA